MLQPQRTQQILTKGLVVVSRVIIRHLHSNCQRHHSGH